jgi:IS30 family transposase
LGSESFFCKPYRSWEKGGVENYNGLVRQYFPKGYDFTKITAERLLEVEEEINQRPRNILAYRSSCDLLDKLRTTNETKQPIRRNDSSARYSLTI